MTIEEELFEALKSDAGRERFITENENFIISTASRFSKHFISKSDDEWSIALIAFNSSMDTYDASKGGFLSYSRLIMEHKLTDYFRSQGRFSNELNTEPFVFEGNVDDEADNAGYQATVMKVASVTDENPLRDEIVALNDVLSGYEITFMDLAECSPKAAKTKASCWDIISFMMENPDLVDFMRQKNQIPAKKITDYVDVPRKIVERHRKYLIAATEIMCGDYPLLADYIRQ